jgi:RNA polymerase sigma factor (sigma-70 family)
MGDSHGDGTRRGAAEDLILRTIAAHADSLLRTARRHSMCPDDAHDAYQRSIEIFMAHAERLDPARAAGWLHVVVKREAQAIREARQKLLVASEMDVVAQAPDHRPTPEELALSFDVISRSAEALRRLRPDELRAVWLRAQGHSYSEIGAMTGWTYTKVNRCLTEGRRSFLQRYKGIETGHECERWLPVISAMVDGEATPEQIADLRPHLRNCSGCRATLRALRDSSKPLAAVLPVPLLAAQSGGGDDVTNLLMRLYEGIAGGLHERAVHSVTKAQAIFEAGAAGKAAAVAASAAAVAGGGYASVERAIERPAVARSSTLTQTRETEPRKRPVLTTGSSRQETPQRTVTAKAVKSSPARSRSRSEFGASRGTRASRPAPEFQRSIRRGSSATVPLTHAAATAATSASSPAGSAPARRAPEFSSRIAPEFSP